MCVGEGEGDSGGTPDLIGWGGGGGVLLDLKMHGPY